MPEVDAFTYNDIYELLRGEKNSADLEVLTPAVLAKMAHYIAAKRRLLESQPGGTFSGAKERSKILLEINNAQQALQDLFERRQRKVINRAIFTVRTDSKIKDSTNMLESEEELYNVLLKSLKKSMESFSDVIEGHEESGGKAAAKVEEKKEVAAVEANKSLKVKFLDAVPELVDTSLAKHGPFEAGDTATLPIELASLLVRQGKAKEA